jgi:hypothetical protein
MRCLATKLWSKMEQLFSSLDLSGVIADLMTCIVFGVGMMLFFVGFNLLKRVLLRENSSFNDDDDKEEGTY